MMTEDLPYLGKYQGIAAVVNLSICQLVDDPVPVAVAVRYSSPVLDVIKHCATQMG